MVRFATLSLALLAPMAASAAEQDAKKVAQDILTEGAALYDTRDAAAMADSYAEDAELSLVGKDKDTGTYKASVTRGRSAIERFYHNLYRGEKSGTTSRNVVEFAHFVGDDLLIIHGTFQPDISHGRPIPFVQVRAKKGDKWLIMNMQLFLVSEKAG
jgi:ketosteroid isomerase-like protein